MALVVLLIVLVLSLVIVYFTRGNDASTVRSAALVGGIGFLLWIVWQILSTIFPALARPFH